MVESKYHSQVLVRGALLACVKKSCIVVGAEYCGTMFFTHSVNV